MTICERCGGSLARINGRTLRKALALTKAAAFSASKFSNAQWVTVCPTCDAYALGIEFVHPFPFQSAEGVMCVVDDCEGDFFSGGAEVLDLFGFRFTEAALQSAYVSLSDEGAFRDEGQEIRLLEARGASLSASSTAQDFLHFSEAVCNWGRGRRVWGNLLRHYGEADLSEWLKDWLVYASETTDDEKAIAKGTEIKGLGVSFASKHLRMLNPGRFAVLDDVLQQGLGIALNPRGYQLLLSGLRGLNDRLEQPRSIASLETAVFHLVRQTVRSKSDS